MKNLSRLPSDPNERRNVLLRVIRHYEEQDINDTVYHRWLAEAEAAVRALNTSDALEEE